MPILTMIFETAVEALFGGAIATGLFKAVQFYVHKRNERGRDAGVIARAR